MNKIVFSIITLLGSAMLIINPGMNRQICDANRGVVQQDYGRQYKIEQLFKTKQLYKVEHNIVERYKIEPYNTEQYSSDSYIELINKIRITENAGNTNDYTDYNAFDDNDSDWDSDSGGYYSDSSSSSSSGEGLGIILWILHVIPFPFDIILVLLILFPLLKATMKKTKKSYMKRAFDKQINNTPSGVKYVSPPSIQVPDFTSAISNEMKKHDLNFDSGKFLSFAEEAFLNIQDAWTNNDFEKIRVLESEELFKKHERQLSEYKRNGTRNVLGRINVNQSYLYKYVIDNQYEHVTVLIDATMNDYVININNNQITRGDYNTRWRGRYVLTFTRSVETLTGEVKGENEKIDCPNCGAPIAITSAGKCEYCGFIISSSKHGWVVSDYDVIKPNYVVDRRGIVVLRQVNKEETDPNYQETDNTHDNYAQYNNTQYNNTQYNNAQNNNTQYTYTEYNSTPDNNTQYTRKQYTKTQYSTHKYTRQDTIKIKGKSINEVKDNFGFVDDEKK